MNSITFRGSYGSLTTAPRKLLNFGSSRKKQETAAKKITSTIMKHTILQAVPSASYCRLCRARRRSLQYRVLLSAAAAAAAGPLFSVPAAAAAAAVRLLLVRTAAAAAAAAAAAMCLSM